MDLRLLDEVSNLFESADCWKMLGIAPPSDREHPGQTLANLHNEYDHVAIAGAALGATTPQKLHWNETFWDHVGLALELHAIRRVIIVEHQDCGAYRLLLPKEEAAAVGRKTADPSSASGYRWVEPEAERELHRREANKLAAAIKERYPVEVNILYATLPDPCAVHGGVERL